MPQFDGTGPRGCGPRSGRGLGRCDKVMDCTCPFVTALSDDSMQALKAKELLLEEMLVAVRAELLRKKSA